MVILFILLLIFIFLSPSYVPSEYALVEVIQALTLGTSFFIHLKCKKYFLKLSNKFIFIIRAFAFFSFL